MHKSDMQKSDNRGRQVAFTRQDLLMLRMPPTCAVSGEPADTAIVVQVGDVDLILPVCDRIRSEHLRRFGPLRTAWRIRPSVHDDVIRLGNASSAFVEQLLTINEPGRVYAGGLYPLKRSRHADHDIEEVAENAA